MTETMDRIADGGTWRRIDGGWELRFESRLRHSPQRVWNALTKPEGLACWLAEAVIEPAEREKATAFLEAAGGDNGTVHASWSTDGDMRLLVRRWASDTWYPIDSKSRQVWRFDPEGFSEPIGVRIETGDSWMEMEFHPLTASIRYSSKEVY